MPNRNLHLHPEARRAFTLHDRTWQNNRYVYPVLSRRSKGISLGINLNPDKVCNFDCIYCSVDRKIPLPPNSTQDIDPALLRSELSQMLSLALSGQLFTLDPFDKIPDSLRRINDIAFSGDGEPTTCPQFDPAVRLAAELLPTSASHLQPPIKLVLITNASMFHRPAIRETLAFLDAHHGQIWAKLDAGTRAYYDLVDRTPVPFNRILDNLLWSCQTRPTIIQSLFMQVHGQPPPTSEIDAYTQRLAHLANSSGPAGGIQLVQLYTTARATTESYATPLTSQQLESIAQQIRRHLPSLPLEIYP